MIRRITLAPDPYRIILSTLLNLFIHFINKLSNNLVLKQFNYLMALWNQNVFNSRIKKIS